MIVEYRKFSPVLLIQELGLFKDNMKKKNHKWIKANYFGKEKKRVSCLIITEHFEGTEKAFFPGWDKVFNLQEKNIYHPKANLI